MDREKYLKRLDQDMVLRSYSRHTRKVYGREVKNFLAFSGKPVQELTEEDVRNYVLHLMAGSLSKETINLGGCYTQVKRDSECIITQTASKIQVQIFRTCC